MRARAWCWIGVLLMLAGCYSNEYSSNPEVRNKASAKDCKDDDCCSSVTRAGMLKKSQGASGVVHITNVNQDELLRELQTRKGKTILLFRWAAWHGPSIAQLSRIMELKRKYADQELVVCLMSDGPIEDAEVTHTVLAKLKFDGSNFQVKSQSEFEKSSQLWKLHGIPSAVILDKKGSVSSRFDCSIETPFDLTAIEKAIVKELDTK